MSRAITEPVDASWIPLPSRRAGARRSPGMTMFDLGTSAGLEEKVDNVSKETGVVSSAMVNGIAAVEVSSLIV